MRTALAFIVFLAATLAGVALGWQPRLALFGFFGGLFIGALAAQRLQRRASLADYRGVLYRTSVGAILGGVIGFALDFFLPMILAPHAGQGPLFLLGPAGLLGGALAGLARHLLRKP